MNIKKDIFVIILNEIQMSAVLNYIFKQHGNQKEILLYFHDLFTNELNFTSKIRYKIPFYDYRSWICYMNPIKGGKIELAFIYGNELSNKQGLLQKKKRKQIAGIEFENLEDIPLEVVHEIIQEAILLDEATAYKSKKN